MYKCKKCCNSYNYDCNLFEKSCNNVEPISDYNCNCSCGFDNEYSAFPANYMYGQSYVPFQQLNNTFRPEIGLEKGTIFPELVSPYAPCQSVEEINYLKNSNKIGEGCNG
ncbi:MAG: spore coat associated protein CotJA [Clostridia bacterium]|nr:spore coat associated protein CotJA [Clostridia bacterium]